MRLLYSLLAAGWLSGLPGLFSFPQVARAQAPGWSGAAASSTTSASPNTSWAKAVATDASGNVFVAGYFNGSASFGSTTLTDAGNADVYVAKYVPATNTWAWAYRAGGTGGDYGLGLAVSGNSVYVTGFISNNAANSNAVTFGGLPLAGASPAVSGDMFVAKYLDQGSSATLAWAQAGGGTGPDQGTAVAVSGSSVYVTGFVSNSLSNQRAVVFGGGGTTAGTSPQYGASTSANGPDLLLAKYQDNGATGQYVWSHVGGGTGDDQGRAVAVSGSSVYVTGNITNTRANAYAVVFGGSGPTAGTVPQYGASTNANLDLVLAKYQDNGATATLGWTQVGGGQGGDYGGGLAVSGTSVYVAGTLYHNAANTYAVTFGGSGATAGTATVAAASANSSYDLLLTKYQDNGPTASFAWGLTGGGIRSEEGSALALRGQQLVVGGYFSPEVTFGPTTISTPTNAAVSGLARLTDPSLPLAATAPAAPPDLALSPNPAPGRATLTGATPGAAVQVLDALGRVAATATAGPDGTARLGGLAPGLYLVRAGAGSVRLAVE